MLDQASRIPRTPDVFESPEQAGAESSLARLGHLADDTAAGCDGVWNSGAAPPSSGRAGLGIVNDRREFRGPFPDTQQPQSGVASGGTAPDSTLRTIAPDMKAWLCGVRDRIVADTAKKIYVIGYAKDNPVLGFAVAEMAAEFLIESGLDPRLISVSRDDQAMTGPDVWLRVIEIPTPAGATARKAFSGVVSI